ncbi:MAG: spore gernimation protein [Clostridia bacterium BRH_c25]|nr:MAG: spore gernimation protein [Clostridia bacterium BRH_c25]
MNKELISDQQGINLTVLFIFGSTLVMGTGGQAKGDTWIAVMLVLFLSVPVLMVYARILSRYPGKDLYDILEEVFGKYLGRAFSLAFIWFSFHLGALVLRNFGEFMNTVGLPETPKAVPIIMFALICAIGVKSGIETLGKCSSLFIVGVFSLLFLLAFLTIPNMKSENLLPIMYDGFKPVLQGTFSAFSFPFGELVVFMMVFDSLKKPNSSYKVYLKSLVIGGLVVFFISIRNVMVLGADTLGSVYFPSYTAISRINIGNFLQRLEIAVSIVFTLSGFIKISICLMAATKGITKLFGFKDYRVFVTPVGLLMVNLAYLVYDSIMEMFEWAFEIWPYYAFPFQVILPLIILIAVELKARLQNKNKQAKESNTD